MCVSSQFVNLSSERAEKAPWYTVHLYLFVSCDCFGLTTHMYMYMYKCQSLFYDLKCRHVFIVQNISLYINGCTCVDALECSVMCKHKPMLMLPWSQFEK